VGSFIVTKECGNHFIIKKAGAKASAFLLFYLSNGFASSGDAKGFS